MKRNTRRRYCCRGAAARRGGLWPEGREPKPAPRYADGTMRLDREPGEKGYWDTADRRQPRRERRHASQFEANGKLKNLADAAKVAPFQPWALALYKYRQQNDFVDDPMKVCIGPGNPRQMMTPGGVRFIQDNNYKRMYMIFGGGNRNWRIIFMDGRDAAVARRSHRHLPRPCRRQVGRRHAGGRVHRIQHALLDVSNGGLPHTEALKLTERFTRVIARCARVRSDDRRSAHLHASLEGGLDAAAGCPAISRNSSAKTVVNRRTTMTNAKFSRAANACWEPRADRRRHGRPGASFLRRAVRLQQARQRWTASSPRSSGPIRTSTSIVDVTDAKTKKVTQLGLRDGPAAHAADAPAGSGTA